MREFGESSRLGQFRPAAIFRQIFRASVAAAIVFGAWPNAAWAWDAGHTAKVGNIDVTDAENFGFRVYLTPMRSMCGAGTAEWAYVNKSYDNYDAVVSSILTARADRSNIVMYVTRDGSSAYCKIGYIVLLSPD